MDRIISYAGALPRIADILGLQQDMMIALGWLTQATLGVNTIIEGLAVSPTSPASMSVVVGAGQITALTVLERSPYGVLPADTADSLVKNGINPSQATAGPLSTPGTPGQSQNWLVQVQFLEVDTGSMVLNYYNALNPALALSGPGGNSASQATQRRQTVAIQLKSGVAATSGTQVTPTPDPGWTGIASIQAPYGATVLSAGNITALTTAPTVPFKLGPGMVPGFSRMACFTSVGITNFVVPAGVVRARITVIGGGGAGGNAVGASGAGCGGSGGGRARGVVVGLTAGQIIPVTVGAGGLPSGTAGGTGLAGGTSSFGTYMSATAGGGGGGNSSGFGATGSGIGGTSNEAGGMGAGTVITAALILSGFGGAAPGYCPTLYAGLSGGVGVNGINAPFFGCGGSGALSTTATPYSGGLGGAGFVSVEY